MIWGSAFIAQSVGNSIGPFTFQAVRCFLAVAFLVLVTTVFGIAQGKSVLTGWKNKNLWKTGLWCGLALPFMISESPVLSDILQYWCPLVFAGVLSMGVAYTLQILGQKDLEPTPASLIMSLESVFAAIGAWLILHEQMTSVELAGSALVFAAVIISQIPTKKLHR